MTPHARNLNQDATYWAPALNDGLGGATFAAPVPIRCRWQDVAELFRDARGRELTSSAVVYADRELAVRGYLAPGDHAEGDPRDAPDTWEVRGVASSPDRVARRQLFKVYL